MPYSVIDRLLSEERAPALAHVREQECIGCTKCIQACPVDAIIGSAKKMHTILTTECIGCGLCVEPCPVDCIDLIPQEHAIYNPEKARSRHIAIQARAEKTLQEKKLLNKQKDMRTKQAYIQQALARFETKKTPRS